jgi:hypothetical protein
MYTLGILEFDRELQQPAFGHENPSCHSAHLASSTSSLSEDRAIFAAYLWHVSLVLLAFAVMLGRHMPWYLSISDLPSTRTFSAIAELHLHMLRPRPIHCVTAQLRTSVENQVPHPSTYQSLDAHSRDVTLAHI